jgi:hypothetical protein
MVETPPVCTYVMLIWGCIWITNCIVGLVRFALFWCRIVALFILVWVGSTYVVSDCKFVSNASNFAISQYSSIPINTARLHATISIFVKDTATIVHNIPAGRW